MSSLRNVTAHKPFGYQEFGVRIGNNNPHYVSTAQDIEYQQHCTSKKEKVLTTEDLSLVIRLGLEPKTPTLKVLCSTS